MTRFENELAIILDYCSRNGAINNEDAVKIAKKYSARLLEMHDIDRMEDEKLGTMYIARDEGICYDEDERKSQGKLHLFYDTPLIHQDPQTNTRKFDCARCIAEIPSYMYPEIKDGDCYEISITMDKCRSKNFIC